MAVATFRFYEELNDFVAPSRRGRDFAARCESTVKHAIETLGVPHTEVELILVNGESVGFDRRLADGDRVSVYPMFESFDIAPLLRVREQPLRSVRFIADAHLGGLARLLRMLGFDTLYDNGWDDEEIRRVAVAERRIVLTRDRALLMCNAVTHGCYVRARAPEAQLAELLRRLQLGRAARPLTRCLRCNAELVDVDKAAVRDRLPPAVAASQQRFQSCPACARVYWEGSHWRRMGERVRRWLADDVACTDASQ